MQSIFGVPETMFLRICLGSTLSQISIDFDLEKSFIVRDDHFSMASSKTRSSTESSLPVTSIKRLYRTQSDKVLGGVYGGIATYFEIDPVIVRIGWVLGTLVSMGFGIIAYIVAWIIMPQKSNA